MVLLFTSLALSLAANAGCIRVEEEYVRVADVPQAAGSGLGAEEILFRAPAVGVRRTVEGAEMRRLLHLPESAPALPPACFERASESLSPEKIIEAMRKNFPSGDVSIRIDEYSRYPIPKGRLEFSRAGLFATAATVPGRVVLWRGKVVDAAGRSTPVWARIVIATTREVLTCRRTLEPGAKIEPEDLILVPKAALPFEAPSSLQLADAIGMAAKRRIPAGSEVTRQMLSEPFEIEARQTVTLEVRADLVRLKMSAIAEGRGRTGDYIWLKQTVTGKRLRGRITGPRTAIVEINPISGEKTNNEMDEVSSGNDAAGVPQP
ncbi:MAG: flagellar basal body P-ring formation protein FlgA [Acidobacteria bacterium]|nr:flagellar basal body P-ring formation protein FlgA [Acidobacteriota bacterium]